MSLTDEIGNRNVPYLPFGLKGDVVEVRAPKDFVDRARRLVEKAEAEQRNGDRVIRIGVTLFAGSVCGCDVVIDPDLPAGEMVLDIVETIHIREPE